MKKAEVVPEQEQQQHMAAGNGSTAEGERKQGEGGQERVEGGESDEEGESESMEGDEEDIDLDMMGMSAADLDTMVENIPSSPSSTATEQEGSETQQGTQQGTQQQEEQRSQQQQEQQQQEEQQQHRQQIGRHAMVPEPKSFDEIVLEDVQSRIRVAQLVNKEFKVINDTLSAEVEMLQQTIGGFEKGTEAWRVANAASNMLTTNINRWQEQEAEAAMKPLCESTQEFTLLWDLIGTLKNWMEQLGIQAPGEQEQGQSGMVWEEAMEVRLGSAYNCCAGFAFFSVAASTAVGNSSGASPSCTVSPPAAAAAASSDGACIVRKTSVKAGQTPATAASKVAFTPVGAVAMATQPATASPADRAAPATVSHTDAGEGTHSSEAMEASGVIKGAHINSNAGGSPGHSSMKRRRLDMEVR